MIDLPLPTRLELLHALANLSPAWTLLAKQLVRYAHGLSPAADVHEDPETAPIQSATPSSHHPALPPLSGTPLLLRRLVGW